MKVKTNLHTKGTLKGTSKSFPLTNIKNLKNKIWKKINSLSDIPNLSHIHQLSVTYFGHLEAYFCSIFHFYEE